MVLFENPMGLIFVGIAIEAILGVILYMTGRGIYLIAMIGVLLVVFVGVGLEWVIVTERERVEASIEEIRAAMEANDVERVIESISPSNRKTRSDARWAMGEVTFSRVKITDREIGKINELTSPPTATARLTILVSGKDRQGLLTHTTYAAKLDVTFQLENDRWVVIEHKWHNDPR